MGSGAETAARDGRVAGRARREGGRAQGAPLPAVLRAGLRSPRCRATVRALAVLDRTKEPGAVGEPLYLDVVAALREARTRRTRSRAARGRRRPLRALVEGVHAGDGEGGLRRAGARSGRATTSRSASSTTSPTRRCPCDADFDIEPRRRGAGASSSAWAPTARWAPTRTRSRSSARRPTTTPRATSSTTRRSPARSPSRTCASARGRSAPPT